MSLVWIEEEGLRYLKVDTNTFIPEYLIDYYLTNVEEMKERV